MSIATSVHIKPSRIFRYLIFSFCAALLFTAVLIPFDFGAHFSKTFCILFAVLAFGSSFLLLRYLRTQKGVTRLEMNASGEIYLAYGGEKVRGEKVTLSAGSALWQFFMALHFSKENGEKSVLLIFPDSVGAEKWRELSIALRWIHKRRPNGKSA